MRMLNISRRHQPSSMVRLELEYLIERAASEAYRSIKLQPFFQQLDEQFYPLYRQALGNG